MRRREQLAHGIRDAAAACLATRVDLPREVFVTVTGVTVSPGAGSATVFVSVLPDLRALEVLAAVRRHRFVLQQCVNHAIARFRVPRIRVALSGSLPAEVVSSPSPAS